MKKTIFQICLIIALVAIALTVSGPFGAVFAKVLSLPDAESYGVPAPSANKDAVGQAKDVLNFLIRNVRLLLGAIAVFMMVLAGFRMILAQGNEDEVEKQKTALTFAIIGLALVGVSGEIEKIFSLEGGGFLTDPKTILARTALFDKQVQIIITFIKYIIGSAAVLMMINSGLNLLTVSGEEEKITRAKKNLTWSGIGLVLIILSDTVINKVFFKIDRSAVFGTEGAEPKLAIGRGMQELVGATNFMLTVVGPILVLLLLAGGIMYVASRGEEEMTGKAKKIITAAIIGIVIVYGAFAIVSTLISGQFE